MTATTPTPATRRLNYNEAARHIGVPLGTLRSMVSRRQVPHYRLGLRSVVFDVAELDAWLAARHVEAA